MWPRLSKGTGFGDLLWSSAPCEIVGKAFDARHVVAEQNRRAARIVISQRPNLSAPLAVDLDIYEWRHLIDNFFCKLKGLKRAATRTGEADTSRVVMIHRNTSLINSR